MSVDLSTHPSLATMPPQTTIRDRLGTQDLVAFSAHKIPLPASADWTQREERARAMLTRVLNLGTTVAIVGSGCSRPFGYPSWTGLALELLKKASDVQAASAETLRTYRDQVQRWVDAETEGHQEADADQLMFFINFCQRALEAHGARDQFLGVFEQQFSGPGEFPGDVPKPIDALLDLGLRRFVTTNYDVLIERTISRRFDVPLDRFGLGTPSSSPGPPRLGGEPSDELSPLSFTQEPGFARELARFALDRIGPRKYPMVFHCHGRFDRPGSIIASERDYQQWYVAETDASGVAFRQTNILLLESNPLLFVGYGLRDLDFLEPLRRLLATHPFYQQSRPIFALMPLSVTEEKRQRDISRYEMLHARYGLHVVTYDKPDTQGLSVDDRNAAWGARLAREIGRVGEEWKSARSDWTCKPPARRPRIDTSPPAPCLVTEFIGQGLRDVSRLTKGAPAVDRAIEMIQRGARVLYLQGQSGVGKSATAVEMIRRLSTETRAESFDGYFFWNSHYDNEALIAQERALAYLRGRPRQDEVSGFSDLLHALRTRRFLVIVDGCERLLVQGRTPKEHRIFARPFRDLIEAAATAENGSVLVLAGRRWPSDLDEIRQQLADDISARAGVAGSTDALGEARRLLARLDLGRLRVDSLLVNGSRDGLRFAGLGPTDRPLIGKIFSLLDGHDYAVLLANAFVVERADEATSPRDAAELLCRELAEMSPERRRRGMVRLMIEALDRSQPGDHLFQRLVDRLSLFTVPFGSETFDRLAALELETVSGRSDPRDLRQRLQRSFLLFEVEKEGRDKALVLHPMVRECLVARPHSLSGSALPEFGPQGYTTRNGGFDPGSDSRCQLFEETFGYLFDLAPPVANSSRSGVDRCRDLYALVRGQADATGALHWEHGVRRGGHVRRTIQLVALAKHVSDETMRWTYRSRDRSAVQCEDAALHLGELLWLYNDTGLSLFVEGLMPDAYSVWEQAFEIARVIEGPDTPGRYTAEVLLSLMYTFFEMGRIASAVRYLDKVDRVCEQVGDPDLEARVIGFHGMVQHAQGNLRSAQRLYEQADRLLRDLNPRALCFFQGFHAQLEVRLGDLPRAELLANSARALAESNRYPDLAIAAQVFKADVLVEQDKLSEARVELNEALDRAGDIGTRWLEAIVLQSLSRVVLKQGDAEGARSQAMRALGLSNELGLGLVMTRSLQALGLAMVQAPRGHALGVAYLWLAKQLADSQQYWLRAGDLQGDLRRNGLSRQR